MIFRRRCPPEGARRASHAQRADVELAAEFAFTPPLHAEARRHFQRYAPPPARSAGAYASAAAFARRLFTAQANGVAFRAASAFRLPRADARHDAPRRALQHTILWRVASA